GRPRNVDEFGGTAASPSSSASGSATTTSAAAGSSTSSSSSSDDSSSSIMQSIAERRNILVDEVKEVIADVPLNSWGDTLFSGYATTYIDTSRLCTGQYELWWVTRTKSGPYVQLRKPFTVVAPSCTELQILPHVD
ncbi:hypothetical protein FOZ62_009253, partial [Perkinsus olseni]